MSNQTKYIHIHAKCDFFEIFEQIAESKSVQRLTEIRKMFLNEKRRRGIKTRLPKVIQRAFGSEEILKEERLSVKTRVVNPTLF